MSAASELSCARRAWSEPVCFEGFGLLRTDRIVFRAEQRAAPAAARQPIPSRTGFRRVETIAAPAGAYEQHARAKRVMAYR